MKFNPDREAQWILCRAAKLADGLPFTREHLATALEEQRATGAVYLTGNPRGRGSLPPGIVAEYEAGQSLQMLASRYGVSFPTIYQHLRDLGVRMRSRGARKGSIHQGKTRKVPLARLPELLADFNAGKTLATIGDCYGISRERVRQIAQANGCKARRAA